ncbi:unnamed protein product [Orchesella dallaii]|uniref:Uncharacterized protein n=1 Tax=Orchesella dallaii TaxID=48710 RepID=A0ABP1RN40_9HEXA
MEVVVEVVKVLPRIDLDVDPNSLKSLNEHLAQYGSWKGYDMDVSVRTVVEQIYSAFVNSLQTYKFIPQGRYILTSWPGGEWDVFALNDNVVVWKGLSAAPQSAFVCVLISIINGMPVLSMLPVTERPWITSAVPKSAFVCALISIINGMPVYQCWQYQMQRMVLV